MTTRRDWLKGFVGAGTTLLLAACAPAAAPAPTAAPAAKPTTAPAGASAPAATTAPAATGAPAAKPTTAAPAQAAPTGGTVTFVLENDVIDFDPMLSRAFVDRNAHYQIYDSLVRIDASGKIIPWLAEKWDTSSDGKTVTFTLRQGVKYHDGTDFNADSVKWNIDRYTQTKESARTGELAPVASVTVKDPNTVVFNLKTPFSPLLSQLVDRAGMMVSRQVVESAGADFTRKAFKAGTGPFILTEAVKDDHITMERNPSWWGSSSQGGPYIDKLIIRPVTNSDVRFTNLRTGDAQAANNIAGKDVATAKSDSTLKYQEKPGLAFDSFIPNRASGFIFEEGRYVKAVSMAIDRAEILQKVFFNVGTVGYGTVAPPQFAFDPNFKPYEKADPEGAKALVQQVGKGPLSFELLVPSGDPVLVQLAQLVQAQLKNADIDAQISQLEFAQILDMQTKHVFKGLTQVGWSGRIDPDGNTYDHIYTGRPFNDSSYSNKQVDQLLDDQRQTTDEAKRKDDFRKAEQIYVVDDPARVWYRFRAAQLLTSSKLTGLEVYPDGLIRFHAAQLQK